VRAGLVLFSALPGPAQSLEQVLSRVWEASESVRLAAPNLPARQKLPHAPFRSSARFRPRLANATLEPPKLQYRTRKVISEYGFGGFREDPGVSEDSRTVASLEKARRTPRKAGLSSRPRSDSRLPGTITETESAATPNGWQSASAKAEHRFERIFLHNGKQGGEDDDLAPDDEKTAGRDTVQTWYVKDHRSMRLLLRCRYHDTTVTPAMDLPAPLETCGLTLDQVHGAVPPRRGKTPRPRRVSRSPSLRRCTIDAGQPETSAAEVR